MARLKRYSGTNSMGLKAKLDGVKEEEILACTNGCRVVLVIETGNQRKRAGFWKGRRCKMGRNLFDFGHA